ncbi:MAG TPA: divalent metal cation transporter, partial [Acidimicrobiales bacterium]|nr:divalent metal cation transporter [Acidimicrobiales bacterium]
MATLIPLSERRSSLDRAHQGDIEGALGRLSMADTAPRRSISRWLATLLAVVGPGIVVMVADNDAGGISTYAEAGRNYGSGLLWCLLLLAGVLFVNQEMVARLGAVTGVGHARLIRERFGRCWGQFALGDLLLLNLLTIITEFIGASLALGYFGVSRFVAVPLTAVVLCAVPATGNYRHWERAMYVFVAGSLVTVPLAALGYLRVHSSPAVPLLGDVRGAGASGFLLLLLALAGTTVAPWQLFFQQSNVVDKRITPRWISYERVDTLLGTALFVAIAAGVFMGCAYAFNGLPPHGGAFLDAGDIAVVLRDRLGPAAGDLFAVALLNGSIIGAAAVSLAT